jgi:release factor glutamine methyltransferase
LPEATLAATGLRLTNDAVGRLAAAGVENPVLDAQLLLAHAAGISRERLLMEYDSPVPGEISARFDELIVRRVDREPVAYILGRKEFRHLTLSVDPRVLIPRPETEMLVEVGLSLDRGARVVELGTGSGAVALALKDERPDLEVWATDVSPDALEVAQENARSLALDVRFVPADLLEGVPAGFDAVLANLPYVAQDARLAPEIGYEPRAALFAGRDGLALIRRLMGMLADVPLVALEVGAGEAQDVPGQALEVADLLRGSGFRSIEILRDLAGHERVLVGRR